MKAVTRAAPITSSRTAWIVLFVAAAIAVKGLILFIGIPLYQAFFPTDYQADLFPDQYDLLASNLIEGNGYRFFPDTASTTFRTPGFVLVLAGLFWAFGKSLTAVKAFHLVLSTATAYIVYRLGLRITNNVTIAVLAALLYFFFPGTILSDSRGGIETVLTFSIALSILLLYRAIEVNKIGAYAAAGACFGGLMLVKSSAGLFPVALLIYLLAVRPNGGTVKGELVKITAFGLAAALVMSPWIIRNAQLTGRFIPTMSAGSLAAFQGLYVVKNQDSGKEHGDLLWQAAAKQSEIAKNMGLRFKDDFFPQFYTTEDELRFYDYLKKTVIDDFRSNPGLLLEAVKFNAYAFWFQGRTAKATFYNTLLAAPFLVLALAGVWLSARKKYPVAIILLFMGSFYAAHLPILGLARYYIPLVPLISIFAAIAIGWIGECLHRKRIALKIAAEGPA